MLAASIDVEEFSCLVFALYCLLLERKKGLKGPLRPLKEHTVRETVSSCCMSRMGPVLAASQLNREKCLFAVKDIYW